MDVRLYSIIYDALNDIRAAMEGLLEPTLKERVLGRVEVRQMFTIPKPAWWPVVAWWMASSPGECRCPRDSGQCGRL